MPHPFPTRRSSDLNGMQVAQYFHATVGMVMIAVILAHIYIGTLGMEGAYRAMGSGEVDLTWAKEHHSVWVEQERAKAEDERATARSEEHTSELQSLMRTSYAVFCLKKKKKP